MDDIQAHWSKIYALLFWRTIQFTSAKPDELEISRIIQNIYPV